MGKDWNWAFVFGKNKLCWLFPIDQEENVRSTGDGTVFMK